MRIGLVVFVLMVFSRAAVAQGPECYDEGHLAELPQQPLNICAAYRYGEADRELNRVYRQAVDHVFDASALRDAQRAWITFRDLACAAETAGFEDGSMYPMVLNGCLERQTLRRIEDLTQFMGLR